MLERPRLAQSDNGLNVRFCRKADMTAGTGSVSHSKTKLLISDASLKPVSHDKSLISADLA